jgi:hypothetical protein
VGFCGNLCNPAAPSQRRQTPLGKFLDAHKLARPETYKKRLELFAKAIEFRSSDALTQAKSRLAVTRAKQLRVLQMQLEDYRRQIEELFAQHPDHDLFGSYQEPAPKSRRVVGRTGGGS